MLYLANDGLPIGATTPGADSAPPQGNATLRVVERLLGRRDKALAGVALLYALGYGVWVGVSMIPLLVGAGIAYPYLPQELGGVRARCAFMDTERLKLSDEVQMAVLSPDVRTITGPPVVTTRQLDILYSGSDFWLVTPRRAQDSRGTAATSGPAEPRVYEIRKGVVQTVRWCGQGRPMRW